jgi:hypothetical protein
MENEKPPVKFANKKLYEDIFSTSFVVCKDQIIQDSESPIWDCLKLLMKLIVKNLDVINNKNSNVRKVTLQITATAIVEVK